MCLETRYLITKKLEAKALVQDALVDRMEQLAKFCKSILEAEKDDLNNVQMGMMEGSGARDGGRAGVDDENDFSQVTRDSISPVIWKDTVLVITIF